MLNEVSRFFRARAHQELARVFRPGFRFTLLGFAGLLVVVAMTIAPLSSGVNALGEAAYMAAVGILGFAALSRRSKDCTFRLGFAASGGVFLLVSGWLFIPGVAGQPDFGRVLQAISALAFGVLGGLLTRQLTTATEVVNRVPSSPPQASR
jgi:hypothetical protein